MGRAKEINVANRDHFVALSECHLLNEGALAEMSYYPNEWPAPRAEQLVKYMDEAGVDVAFALREPAMNVSGHASCMSTNGFILQEIEPYPERLYFECNVGPILRRGVENAIWELEYLVKERGARLCKVYAPEDDGPLNDRRLWPFYEKACELDIPLTVHTGTAYVLPHPDKNTAPALLDDILLDFPELTVIAYHMGWPHSEELIGLAGKHRNLYLSLSGIVGWFARAPYRGYHMIGESLEWAGPDKIVMGLDMPFDETKRIVDYIRNLEMPEELQEKWGYSAITDEIRAKILGLTLAKLAKIEPTKRVD
jgi:predicted TIM-barrel fold metal-dependent hydrolase